MIYKFKSKATGDLIMLGPQGDEMLRLLGREPAPQGIIAVDDLPAAVGALSAAVEADDAARRAAGRSDEADDRGEADGDGGAHGISLRRRLWPMVEMLKQAAAEGQPVVWGV